MAEKEGNYLEGSASSMFTYFLLKAIREGYIEGSYLSHAKKATFLITHILIFLP